MLARIAGEQWTTVLFEAPGRVGALLADLADAAGPERRGVVARELTKIHEEIVPGSLAELAARFAGADDAVRGECTILIEGAPSAAEEEDPERARHAAVRLLAAGISRKEVAGLLTELFGVARNEAYDMVVTEGKRGREAEGKG